MRTYMTYERIYIIYIYIYTQKISLERTTRLARSRSPIIHTHTHIRIHTHSADACTHAHTGAVWVSCNMLTEYALCSCFSFCRHYIVICAKSSSVEHHIKWWVCVHTYVHSIEYRFTLTVYNYSSGVRMFVMIMTLCLFRWGYCCILVTHTLPQTLSLSLFLSLSLSLSFSLSCRSGLVESKIRILVSKLEFNDGIELAHVYPTAYGPPPGEKYVYIQALVAVL